jgi:divalent metal cation (Fe/Co/Zn/Cd) transporter
MQNGLATQGHETLTVVQRARERSLFTAILLDLTTTVPLIAVVLWSGSLTMLADLVRAVLLIALELFAFHTMRKVHRRRLLHYDFGTGKLEQFANFLLGCAMLAGAAWIGLKMLVRVQSPPTQDEAGLWAAAVICFLSLALNGYCLYALWRSGKDGTSIVMNGQIQSRLAKLIASGLVALTMLANAAAGTKAMALAADLAGSALVVAVMVMIGGSLCRKALPHLLDRTIDEHGHAAINRVLARHFDDYDSLSYVQARLSGAGATVQIGLAFVPTTSIGSVQQVADLVARDVSELIPGARVTVVPAAMLPPPVDESTSR